MSPTKVPMLLSAALLIFCVVGIESGRADSVLAEAMLWTGGTDTLLTKVIHAQTQDRLVFSNGGKTVRYGPEHASLRSHTLVSPLGEKSGPYLITRWGGGVRAEWVAIFDLSALGKPLQAEFGSEEEAYYSITPDCVIVRHVEPVDRSKCEEPIGGVCTEVVDTEWCPGKADE